MMSALGFLWDLFGGWEWALGLLGGPLAIAGMFLRKWKWVLVAVGVALVVVAFLTLMLSSARKDATIAGLRGEVRVLAGKLESATRDIRDCKRTNDNNLAETQKVKAGAQAQIDALAADRDRIAAEVPKIRIVKETIHVAAKECPGSAAPYRVVADWLRDNPDPAARADHPDQGSGAGRAGPAADLRGRASAGRRPY